MGTQGSSGDEWGFTTLQERGAGCTGHQYVLGGSGKCPEVCAGVGVVLVPHRAAPPWGCVQEMGLWLSPPWGWGSAPPYLK